MTKSTITRERLQEIAEDGFLKHGESKVLARMALAAMDSESGCLPLDYLQGHKDGLEWAAQLAEANHPETGDWLYDDPIELAKAIRKGPEMPPAQSMDSEPVAWMSKGGTVLNGMRQSAHDFVHYNIPLNRHAQPEPVTEREPIAWLNDAYLARGVVDGEAGSEDAGPGYIPVYREAQPAPVVPDERKSFESFMAERFGDLVDHRRAKNGDQGYMAWDMVVAWIVWQARAAMLQAEPVTTANKLGNSPVIPDAWIPVSERMPDDSSDVLCTAEFDGPGDWRKKVGYWHEGKWVVYGASWTPTHWMELPAAPQEVKDAHH